MPTIAILAASRNGHHPDPSIRAVEEAGGRANVIAPSAGARGLSGAGGLLIPDTGFSDGEVDSGALELLGAALAADMPALLTGKGMHLLNAAFGGDAPSPMDTFDDTVEDSASTGDSASTDRQGRRQIYLSPGSKMAAIIGSAGMFRINSDGWGDRMALREAQRADRLMSIAYQLDDGVIEGLESKEHSWVIGVQFLPERAEEVPASFNSLFLGLVERADDYAATGENRI